MNQRSIFAKLAIKAMKYLDTHKYCILLCRGSICMKEVQILAKQLRMATDMYSKFKEKEGEIMGKERMK